MIIMMMTSPVIIIMIIQVQVILSYMKRCEGMLPLDVQEHMR
jgi:hypothetical protein